jgi:ABC-type glycerol-3-phosphate transport system permease component
MKAKRTLALVWQILTYAILVLFIFIALLPCAWMLSTSIKDTTELYDLPPEIIPDNPGPTIKNYVTVLNAQRIYWAAINSIIVTASVMALTLLLTTIAGYGLARHSFKGARVLKLGLLIGQMIPGVVLIVPLYWLFTKIRLIDTLHGLVIADLAGAIPMGVIMLSAFFLTVPKELEEAAKIDGTTEIGALFRVILPIAKPGLVSVAIYTFIHAWEEFLFALNITITTRHRTLPIAIATFQEESNVDWGVMMAASTLVALPVLLLFLLCNKYFIKGLSEGSVKG